MLLEIQNRFLKQPSRYGKVKLFGNVFIPFTTAVGLSSSVSFYSLAKT